MAKQEQQEQEFQKEGGEEGRARSTGAARARDGSGPCAPPKKQEEEKQETGIAKPHKHDVLCGRGGGSNNHHGNLVYRSVVARNRPLYNSCPKHHKVVVARVIVEAVQRQNPPGRFVEKRKDRLWYVVDKKRAIEKTAQALREKSTNIHDPDRDLAGVLFGPGGPDCSALRYDTILAAATTTSTNSDESERRRRNSSSRTEDATGVDVTSNDVGAVQTARDVDLTGLRSSSKSSAGGTTPPPPPATKVMSLLKGSRNNIPTRLKYLTHKVIEDSRGAGGHGKTASASCDSSATDSLAAAASAAAPTPENEKKHDAPSCNNANGKAERGGGVGPKTKKRRAPFEVGGLAVAAKPAAHAAALAGVDFPAARSVLRRVSTNTANANDPPQTTNDSAAPSFPRDNSVSDSLHQTPNVALTSFSLSQNASNSTASAAFPTHPPPRLSRDRPFLAELPGPPQRRTSDASETAVDPSGRPRQRPRMSASSSPTLMCIPPAVVANPRPVLPELRKVSSTYGHLAPPSHLNAGTAKNDSVSATSFDNNKKRPFDNITAPTPNDSIVLPLPSLRPSSSLSSRPLSIAGGNNHVKTNNSKSIPKTKPADELCQIETAPPPMPVRQHSSFGVFVDEVLGPMDASATRSASQTTTTKTNQTSASPDVIDLTAIPPPPPKQQHQSSFGSMLDRLLGRSEAAENSMSVPGSPIDVHEAPPPPSPPSRQSSSFGMLVDFVLGPASSLLGVGNSSKKNDKDDNKSKTKKRKLSSLLSSSPSRNESTPKQFPKKPSSNGPVSLLDPPKLRSDISLLFDTMMAKTSTLDADQAPQPTRLLSQTSSSSFVPQLTSTLGRAASRVLEWLPRGASPLPAPCDGAVVSDEMLMNDQVLALQTPPPPPSSSQPMLSTSPTSQPMLSPPPSASSAPSHNLDPSSLLKPTMLRRNSSLMDDFDESPAQQRLRMVNPNAAH